MAAKSKTETPAPTMADIIRNRAYQMWGVENAASANLATKKKAAKSTAKKSTKPKKQPARKK